MSKQKKPTAASVKARPADKFQDRNLAATNPTKEQFEPTEASPIRQSKRMAGER